ncbi:MAG TPA: acyl-CoA dehydrogenase family protein [Acidimicrobiales bacterium]|nr:acyl-CoA dehydrogenase family protein [Acidimicrobiales bacterium]
MVTPGELFDQAEAWLAGHRADAPRDYGAILPPELVDEGRAWQRALLDAGWAGLHWPQEVGGRGLTVEHTAAWTRACALAQVPPWINMVGLVLTGGSLLAYGTPEQQATHLPRILDATDVWCQLFSEPGAGSDLASLSTRAEADGDTWVLTGQKVWCSNGRVADRGICLARTDPDAKPHAGISFFLVDMHLPGVEVRPLRQMTGGSEFDEVFLDEVRVPADALLGPLHGGWGVAMGTLTNERGYIGSAGISLRRRLDELAAGIATGDLDAVAQDRLVGLLASGRALHALGQRQGAVATVAGSLAKLGVTELLFDLAVLEADLAGADAMLRGEASARLLGAPGGRIAGGTTQVQKNIIGERILGLPKG